MIPDPRDLAAWSARLDAARGRLEGVAHRTPVMTSHTLDERVGARVFLKCENLQRMGAFKFRGAWNAIAALPAEARRRGVVAFSSGNHAQAVALAAREQGAPAVIVMPSTAPASKLEATLGYGAEVVHYDRLGLDRDTLASQIAAERGLALVPPFDHPDVIAGAASAAAELIEDAGPFDRLVVPVGGGGLVSGSSLATHRALAECTIVGVEPAAGDDGRQSLAAGRRIRIDTPDTIADGARTPSLGEITFPIVAAHVQEIVTVTDADLIEAMRFAWTRLKLVIEPTGALGLAAVLTGAARPAGRVGVILSGGNVDPSLAAAWFRDADARAVTAERA